MVDALALGASGAIHGGSTPLPRTIIIAKKLIKYPDGCLVFLILHYLKFASIMS